jgi:hypothetical protein
MYRSVVKPPSGDVNPSCECFVFYSPSFRASIDGRAEKAPGLSEPAARRVSFRALRPQRRRAGLCGTRAFSFASFSFHVKENEETITKTSSGSAWPRFVL